MPTYEYTCSNPDCNHTWERTAQVIKRETRTCPKCKKRTAKRKLSPIAFIFKTGGFYQTDYKNKT